ncbi:MAG: TetR/AcrR family transcriptional regulator [Rhizobacter sp.]
MGRKINLSRDDWTDAALDWIAEHGVASLAIEPLARSLGVTKGGFYWCFGSRDELLQAALERWELLGTQDIIRTVEQAPEARTQVSELLALVAGRIAPHSPEATRIVRLHFALACAANDPLVAPVFQRVTAARLRFLVRVLKLAGLPPKLAKQRATLAQASYIGLVQLLATQGREALGGFKPAELFAVFQKMLLAPAD